MAFKANSSKNETEKAKLNEEVINILTNLKHEAIKRFESESDIKTFLDNIVYFNKYSYNNQILIYLQNPKAQYVAPLKTFNKMGYKIKAGAKGIKIVIPNTYSIVKIKKDDNQFDYKPLFALTNEEKEKYKNKDDDSITYHKQQINGFKIGTIFDASQTNMPLEIINKELNPALENDRASDLEDNFIKAIYRNGFKVRYEEKIESGAKGYCDFEKNEIVVLKGLSNLMRLKVVIHEYAHALAHQHLKNNNMKYVKIREKYETEAESIAYVVSKYLGLDTSMYSQMYLYSWSKDKDFKEIDDSLSSIVNYSKMIINNYEKIVSKDLEQNIAI